MAGDGPPAQRSLGDRGEPVREIALRAVSVRLFAPSSRPGAASQSASVGMMALSIARLLLSVVPVRSVRLACAGWADRAAGGATARRQLARVAEQRTPSAHGAADHLRQQQVVVTGRDAGGDPGSQRGSDR